MKTNLLFALLYNGYTDYASWYTPVQYPKYVEKLRKTFLIDSIATAIKAVQLVLSTELSAYLSEELLKNTVSFSDNKYMGSDTYEIVDIYTALNSMALDELRTKSYQFLDRSVVDNLFYVFHSHYNYIYNCSAILTLLVLNMYNFYKK